MDRRNRGAPLANRAIMTSQLTLRQSHPSPSAQRDRLYRVNLLTAEGEAGTSS
jgi:hypothetical protein